MERADAIIQRLRTLIRKRSVDKTPCDIQALIADTIELLHFRMQKQNVAIVTSVEGEIRPLLADSVGVQQVLVNVINNAIDACALFQEKYHSSGYQGKIACIVTTKLTSFLFAYWITALGYSKRIRPKLL